MISKDSVAHVAGLAKLAFSEDELQQYTAQLDEICLLYTSDAADD